jgi:ribonuclease D
LAGTLRIACGLVRQQEMAVDSPQLVSSSGELRQLVGELLSVPRYALDTEFHRERTYWPHLALVQVAWRPPGSDAPKVALVDPQTTDLLPLADVLEGPGVMVAHAASQDLEVLWRACGALPRRLFDTQVAAGFLGYASPSLPSLVEAFLGLRLAKADRLSDWSRRPLSASQVAYAASDVAHLLDLAEAISRDLESRGRLRWAEEESASLLERPLVRPDPTQAWWKLRDNRALHGPSRGVAQELAAWREVKARELDVLPRAVLPDLALLSIAHQPPKDLAALREVRGLDQRHLAGGAGEEILEAVERGRVLPASEVRSPKGERVSKQLRPAVALASAWLAQLSCDEAIAAPLLATRADIVEWLSGTDGARLGEGWRAEVVGVPLRRLVRGEVSLALDQEGNLVMEERRGGAH